MNMLENDKTEDIEQMITTTESELKQYRDDVINCKDFIQECKDELKRRGQ